MGEPYVYDLDIPNDYFKVKDKDGNYKAGVGAHAEVGASATLLGGSVKGDVGTAVIGANAGASVAFGQVSAQGGIVAGWVDGKPVLQAEGSVGANAVAVSGSVAGRIMGIEVGAKGTFTVGVSAYGNVGFSDGQFNIGFGLSLGIGFVINLVCNLTSIMVISYII